MMSYRKKFTSGIYFSKNLKTKRLDYDSFVITFTSGDDFAVF